jgi:hypothetical protein
MLMRAWLSAVGLAVVFLLAARATNAADDATLFRLFLRDGVSLVSYGEYARVADRVVFSMPTAAGPNPSLQLVNIAANRVDWERTNRYAESARSARYVATQGEIDYADLSAVLTRALNEVSSVTDASKRLAIVEGARKTLAEWPQNHFNYRHTEVRQMLSMLDEAIADLRAAAGGDRFDLSFVALAEPPAAGEPVLPNPTPREAIETVLAAARVTESGVERHSLLHAALVALDRDAAVLPGEWAAATHAAVIAAIEQDLRIDRTYDALVKRMIARAESRARVADVRGVSNVLDLIRKSDAALGQKRPDAVSSALAAVEAQLDVARRLRLVQDRWVLRAPVLRQYSNAISSPLNILRSIEEPLRDIKELAGSTQGALTLVRQQMKSVVLLVGTIIPPEECRAAHALITSAAQLADTAAQIRREAALSGDVARAWDASSAAAGALMLSAKARAEIQVLLRPPPLQ